MGRLGVVLKLVRSGFGELGKVELPRPPGHLQVVVGPHRPISRPRGPELVALNRIENGSPAFGQVNYGTILIIEPAVSSLIYDDCPGVGRGELDRIEHGL